MPGRHQLVLPKRSRLRWISGVAGASIVAALLLAFFPASASADTTVNAQLSLTGVATKDNVLGGSQIGIHPGDTVAFHAAAVPTAGLENIPVLGSLLNSLLGPLSSSLYQVVVTFPSSFPGGAQTVTLGGPTTGKCAGVSSKSVHFPSKGTYTFTWKVQYVLVGLLGCSVNKNAINSTQLNQLQQAGVAINASNSWVGKIVVADNPPPGGVSIQLPGVSVAPSVAGHQLPTVGVPGVNAPTLSVPSIPNLPGVSLPGGAGGGKSTGSGGGSSDSGNQLPVPARVVPKGDGNAVFGNVGSGYFPGVLPGSSSLAGGSGQLLPVAADSAKASGGALPQQNSSGKHKTIELASSKATEPTGQFSVILAIIAVIALSVVAATYARLYVLRRES